MSERQRVGRIGESLAADYLAKKGYRILERGWRTREGEIDIIALDKNETVFVEVKTRRSRRYGFPEAGVSRSKLRKMLCAAEQYLNLAGAEKYQFLDNYRFDIVAVEIDQSGQTHLRHIEGIEY